jgi:iron complex outermembrane receptor protein
MMILAALLAVIPVSPLAAQSTPPAGDSGSQGKLEEIVVVAQKRSENLQNVPISVSVVTNTQLVSQGVKDVTDIRVAVPTLYLASSAGYLTSSLRGVGSNALGPGIENPVALYIDGVYYSSPAASLLTLNNVAQIEVLKGPQGTLFGRNATGGLIQITTREPTQELSGDFNVGYANYQTETFNGYLAGGLTDTLKADMAVSYTHQGEGWGRDIDNGQSVYQLDRDLALRSKIVFEPFEATKITAIGDYESRNDSRGALYVYPNTVVPPGPLGQPAYVPPSNQGYDVDTDVLPRQNSTSSGGSLRWDQGIGDL